MSTTRTRSPSSTLKVSATEVAETSSTSVLMLAFGWPRWASSSRMTRSADLTLTGS
jgi:hypothetical protein